MQRRKRNDSTGMVGLIQEKEILESKLKQLNSKIYVKARSNTKNKIFDQTITDHFSMYHADCISAINNLPNESIHYSIFSPPFLSLYVYSDDYRDMGNSINDEFFYNHFEYLIPELFRVLKQGRLVTVHCSIVNKSITHDGMLGVKDLPGEIVRLFTRHGFEYHSKVMIWKDPLIQAVRTKNVKLAHKQIVKDSAKTGQGFADEMLTFYKPGENTEPIEHPEGFEQYIGTSYLPPAKKSNVQKENKYSHQIWQRYASPVWFDINQSKTLNIKLGRAEKDERHIVPLQLQAIDRCLQLWTNPDDVVLSPFAGIGSEGYQSLINGRKFVGIELKESYYKQAVKNLKGASQKTKNRLI